MTYPCAFTFLIKTFVQIALVNMALIHNKLSIQVRKVHLFNQFSK